MKRVELVANRSVQEDLVRAIETALPEIRYTLIPTAHGRGTGDWKLGTTVWPEENFVWFSYVEDGEAEVIKGLVAESKALYPREGIRVFSVTAD